MTLPSYTASEGKVWDWAEPRYGIARDEHGNEIPGELAQIHLYVKTIYMAGNDKIENYIEVEQPKEE